MMWNIWRSLAQALLMTLVFPTLSAIAGDNHNTFFRVHRIAGDETLIIRSGPAAQHNQIGKIPFNARGLENLFLCRSNWCIVQYENLIGWVDKNYITYDDFRENTYYRIINPANQEAVDILNYPVGQAMTVGKIPANARGVRFLGYCKKSWCPVTYKGLKGWVRQNYLEIWLPDKTYPAGQRKAFKPFSDRKTAENKRKLKFTLGKLAK